jgi:hypothetical protein
MLKFMNERTHTASIDRNNFYFKGVANNTIKLTTPGGEARRRTGRIFFRFLNTNRDHEEINKATPAPLGEISVH